MRSVATAAILGGSGVLSLQGEVHPRASSSHKWFSTGGLPMNDKALIAVALLGSCVVGVGPARTFWTWSAGGAANKTLDPKQLVYEVSGLST